MTEDIIFDSTYKGTDFTKTRLPARVFDSCFFKNCNFAGGDLSDTAFAGCTFEECNLGMANLAGTTFKETVFNGCKMIGLDFSRCNDSILSISFAGCQLDYSFFYHKKMKRTLFRDCSIQEANFTGADLSGAQFTGCNLERTVFEQTNLSSSDFSSAYGYIIDPEKNIITGAKFSLTGIHGLLSRYNIEIL